MEKFTSKSLKITVYLQILLASMAWASDAQIEFIDSDPCNMHDMQKMILKKLHCDNLDILITNQDPKEPSRYLDQLNAQQCQDYISALPQQTQQ